MKIMNRMYLTITYNCGEMEFSSELFYYHKQQFIFPIDTSMNIGDCESTQQNVRKRSGDLDNHAYQSDNETNSTVLDAFDSVDELETTLDQSTKESMYKSDMWFEGAESVDELKRRCDEVLDFL